MHGKGVKHRTIIRDSISPDNILWQFIDESVSLLGAVIAREYGLPCIVGAAFATDVFKTGDTVRLSGTRGVIEKVQLEEEQDNLVA